MLSTMVGSTSPLTESNPSAPSSEKGSVPGDGPEAFPTAAPGAGAKVTLENTASYLNTPLNANELNASNEADPLTFLPPMMEQTNNGNWQDFSQPPQPSMAGALPSIGHLQPQQDMRHNTASLFGQKVFVTGKQHQQQPTATNNGISRSSNVLERALASQQNLGMNHSCEDSATATSLPTNKTSPPAKVPPHKASNPSNKKEPKKRTRHLTERKRVQRNSKEQERSHQINHQFSELRQLLSANGIVVPKGTKSAVLEITLEYIRVLREREQQLERYVHPK